MVMVMVMVMEMMVVVGMATLLRLLLAMIAAPLLWAILVWPALCNEIAFLNAHGACDGVRL